MEPDVDFSKPIQTRAGQKARVICSDIKAVHYPLQVAITMGETGYEEVYAYTSKGKFKHYKQEDDSCDLVNVPVIGETTYAVIKKLFEDTKNLVNDAHNAADSALRARDAAKAKLAEMRDLCHKWNVR